VGVQFHAHSSHFFLSQTLLHSYEGRKKNMRKFKKNTIFHKFTFTIAQKIAILRYVKETTMLIL